MEPRGSAYQALLEAGSAAAAAFGLVLREGEGVTDPGLSLLRDLEPHLLTDQLASEWPGTRLLDTSQARVITYRPATQAMRTLRSAATRLYQWQHPRLPEDLFFQHPDGSTWLTTMAHEREAFLTITAEEAAQLTASIPGLTLQLAEASGAVESSTRPLPEA